MHSCQVVGDRKKLSLLITEQWDAISIIIGGAVKSMGNEVREQVFWPDKNLKRQFSSLSKTCLTKRKLGHRNRKTSLSLFSWNALKTYIMISVTNTRTLQMILFLCCCCFCVYMCLCVFWYPNEKKTVKIMTLFYLIVHFTQFFSSSEIPWPLGQSFILC